MLIQLKPDHVSIYVIQKCTEIQINLTRDFSVWANLITSSRADDDFSGPMDTNVRLRYNGEITWDAPAITKSSCVVDVSYFPFDSQECNLTFGSWTYNGNQVR